MDKLKNRKIKMSKEIEIENGLRVEINTEELTATVIRSPNVTGTVIVPKKKKI